jgi:hypothetical protein
VQTPAPDHIGLNRDTVTVLQKAQEIQRNQGDALLAVDALLLATLESKVRLFFLFVCLDI